MAVAQQSGRDFASDHISIKGLGRAMRALERAGADAQNMRDLMHQLGMLVVTAARPPVKTGRLADSLRAGRGKTKAVVRAGGRRAPHAGIQEYGDPHRGIPATFYIRNALQAQRPNILTQLDAGIDSILRDNDLK